MVMMMAMVMLVMVLMRMATCKRARNGVNGSVATRNERPHAATLCVRVCRCVEIAH